MRAETMPETESRKMVVTEREYEQGSLLGQMFGWYGMR
jgi:hypothetical protein